MVGKQLSQLQEQLEAANITLETSLAPSVPLRVNRTLLDILVSNLLSNAIRHNIPQGRLWVTLSLQQLTIENTGKAQALPAESLFDRFRKPADRPPGSLGLGLPIAHQISETSGFLLTYTFREPNRHRLELRIN